MARTTYILPDTGRVEDLSVVASGRLHSSLYFGIDGEDGTDGKSAYESALQSGFIGTEQDWVASLKGLLSDDAGDVIVSQYANLQGDSVQEALEFLSDRVEANSQDFSVSELDGGWF